MSGLRSCQISSWKLDSSMRIRSPADISARSMSGGRPMLPPIQVRRPDFWPMQPRSEVVVVLPAEPVMPTRGAGARRANSSESLVRGMPRRCASTTSGASMATPPLRASTSQSSSSVGGCSPRTKRSRSAGKSANEARAAASAVAGRMSDRVTYAPAPTAKRARDIPWRAMPRITSRLPFRASMLISLLVKNSTLCAFAPWR